MEILQFKFNQTLGDIQNKINVCTIDSLAGGSSICIDLFSKIFIVASKQDYIIIIFSFAGVILIKVCLNSFGCVSETQ